MKRREFIAGVGAVAWPIAVRAQQPDRVRRMGVLMWFAPCPSRGRQRYGERITAQYHKRKEPSDRPLAVRICAQHLRHVADPTYLAGTTRRSATPMSFHASPGPISFGSAPLGTPSETRPPGRSEIHSLNADFET
jgi:hypothetical protein